MPRKVGVTTWNELLLRSGSHPMKECQQCYKERSVNGKADGMKLLNVRVCLQDPRWSLCQGYQQGGTSTPYSRPEFDSDRVKSFSVSTTIIAIKGYLIQQNTGFSSLQHSIPLSLYLGYIYTRGRWKVLGLAYVKLGTNSRSVGTLTRAGVTATLRVWQSILVAVYRSMGIGRSIWAWWKVLGLAYNRHETRGKQTLGRDPDKSWCHRHTTSMIKLIGRSPWLHEHRRQHMGMVKSSRSSLQSTWNSGQAVVE